MKLPLIVSAIIFISLLTSSANAQLVNFDFTFTGTGSEVSTSGIISGEIIGVSSTGSSTPTDVIITSTPPGYVDPTPLDLSSIDSLASSVTVSNGNITAASIGASNSSGSDILELNLNGFNGFQGNIGGNFFDLTQANAAGPLGGVTYSLDPSSVPEPSTYAMLLGGLGMLAFWRLRTRRA